MIEPLCRLVAEQSPRTGAFVIACFSDPGLVQARKVTERPVLGIGECGALAALTQAETFGVVAILEESAVRQRARFAAMGLSDRFVESLPIGLGILEMEAAADDAILSRMIATGGILRDKHKVDALVMGCASFGRFRTALSTALGIPVVEPVRAAVAMALAALRTV